MLSRSQFSHVLIFELDLTPDTKLRQDLENLFPRKQIKSPAKEAEEIKRATKKEIDKELKERKKKSEKM